MPFLPSDPDDSDNQEFIKRHESRKYLPVENLPDESEDLFEKVALAVDEEETSETIAEIIKSFAEAEKDELSAAKELSLAVNANLNVACCGSEGIFFSDGHEECIFSERDPILPAYLAEKYEKMPRMFSPKRFSNRHGKWRWK
jgi:hypothetical protein